MQMMVNFDTLNTNKMVLLVDRLLKSKEEEMENITASELAGFGVGTLLLCATIAAPRVDSFISTSQRRLILHYHYPVFYLGSFSILNQFY